MQNPFTTDYRDEVRSRLVDMARSDERVVACAVVGSGAGGGLDRWSDIDLTFGVAETASVSEVLDSWTRTVTEDFCGVRLFDVRVGSTVYRVFMLPGTLQVDLSFGPASQFGALGPRFSLVFGEGVEKPHFGAPDPAELMGMGVHHAVRARICIEREKTWQAEHWISHMRDIAMQLACVKSGLDPAHAREYDRLPSEVLDRAAACLVTSVERTSLMEFLGCSVSFLLEEGQEFLREADGDSSRRLTEELRGLSGWET